MSSPNIPQHLESHAAWMEHIARQSAPEQIVRIGRMGQMAHVAALRTQTPQAIEKAAATVGNTEPLGESSNNPTAVVLREAYERSMIAASATDTIKYNAIGQNTSATTSNAIGVKAMSQFVLHGANLAFHDYDRAKQINNNYMSMAYDVIDVDHPVASWMARKLLGATTMMNEYLVLGRQLNGYESLDSKDTAELAQNNDQLWTELQVLRKYGVKPAIAPSLSDSRIQNWLVQDAEDAYGRANSHSLIQQNGGMPVVAVFRGSDIQFASSKTDVVTQLRKNSGVKLQMNTPELLFGENPKPYELTTIHLGRDGHLSTQGGHRLEAVAAELGASDAYEQLRGEILTITYDLLTPVYVHDLSENSAPAVTDPQDASQSSTANKLRPLVLSRIRVLKELGSDIEQAIKDEIADEQAATQTRSSIAAHDVVNFIRRLPEGYRASAEARKQCLEDLGIELAETGETYVRKHTRGGKEPKEQPKGHRAVFTQGRSRSKNRKKRR